MATATITLTVDDVIFDVIDALKLAGEVLEEGVWVPQRDELAEQIEQALLKLLAHVEVRRR